MTTTNDTAQIWQQPFLARNGHTYRWWHMPGSDQENKKLNFALFRRGLIDLRNCEEEENAQDGPEIDRNGPPGDPSADQVSGQHPPRLTTHGRKFRGVAVPRKKQEEPPKVEMTTARRFPNGLPDHMRKHHQPGELEELSGKLLKLADERGIRHHVILARFGINCRKLVVPSSIAKAGKPLKDKLEHAIAKLSSPECEKVA